MRRWRCEKGITLIEVGASIVLFGIVAAGITTAVVGNMKVSRVSRANAMADALIQNKIEQLRTIVPVSATSLPADLTIGTHNDPNNPLTPLGAAQGVFTRSWTVSYVPQMYNGALVGNTPGIVKVVVDVRWTTRNGVGENQAAKISAVTYACITSNCG